MVFSEISTSGGFEGWRKGKALLDQRPDERTDLNEMRFRDIDAFARGGKGLPVLGRRQWKHHSGNGPSVIIGLGKI